MKHSSAILIAILALIAGYFTHSILNKSVTLPTESSHKMTLELLGEIISEKAETVKGDGPIWEFQISGIPMACITDKNYDRMRIIAPIVEASQLTDEHRQIMLESNYHNALDARYATSNGVLYSTFIHPLSPLKKAQVESALRQVAELAKTFGTTYSSGELSFGSQGTEM